MTKHSYSVTVREQNPETGAALDGKVLEMTAQSHDDLLEIAGKVAARGLFGENETKVFAVGLKMFAGVLLAHRKDPLFADFAPHFGDFMKRLKAMPPR